MMAKRGYPKKGTLAWKIASDDWSDLTSAEIAEVLDEDARRIVNAVSYLKKCYGIEVEYKRRKKRVKRETDGEKGRCGKHTMQERVYALKDVSAEMTVDEIAEKAGLTVAQVKNALPLLKRKGLRFEYKRKPPFNGYRGRKKVAKE